MVRYTFLLAGAAAVGSLPIALELRPVNLFENEQLEEFYLCSVNPKGQVSTSAIIISGGPSGVVIEVQC